MTIRVGRILAVSFIGLAVTWGMARGAETAAATAEAVYPPEVVRADFDELYARLRASHYNLYARRSEANYDRLHVSMRTSFTTPLTRSQVAMRFQRFLAYGRIAHARIDFPREAFEAWRSAGGREFPLGLRMVGGKIYVTENLSGAADLLPGDELLDVNGTRTQQWFERVTAPLSADNAYMASAMLEFSLPRLVWVAAPDASAFALRVRSADGKPRVVTVPARTRVEIDAARAAQPKTHELSWDAREYRMLDDGVAYLRPGPFYESDPNAPNPWDPRAFSAFVDEAFRSFIKAGARTLLIDLRDNAGGDNSFSDLMLNWFATRPYRFASRFEIKVSDAAVESNRKRLELAGDSPDATSLKFAAAYAGRGPGDIVSFEIPTAHPRQSERFAGKVWVLINRHSYSNTVMVAATVQDYGFGTVIGEETSDLATTYGAMEQFELSRTGVVVGFPKAYIVRPSGATGARGVVPDIAIASPIVPGKEDIVLQKALEIVGRRRR